METSSLNVRHMLQLLQIVESGSINKAAAQLHISQPALTRSVNHLEQSLGVLLLDRSVKGVAPTPYGELLLEHARNVQANLRSALTDIEAMRDRQVRSLRVGTTSGIGWLLTQSISALQVNNPALRIKAVEGHTANLHAQLRLGELDVVICSKTDRLDQGLTSETLFRQGFSLWVRAGHPLAHRDDIELKDLAAEDWVIPQRDSRLRAVLETALNHANIKLTGSIIECSSQVIVRDLLLEKNRVALLSDRALELEHERGLVARLRGHFSFEPRTYEVITRQGTQSPSVRWLHTQLKLVLAKADLASNDAKTSRYRPNRRSNVG